MSKVFRMADTGEREEQMPAVPCITWDIEMRFGGPSVYPMPGLPPTTLNPGPDLEIIIKNIDQSLCPPSTNATECPMFSIPNPLMIDLVVDQVLQYLDFDTLKTCRRVCKKWDEIVFPKMQKNVIVSCPKGGKGLKAMRFRKVLSQAFEEGRAFSRFHFKKPRQLETMAMIKWMEEYGHNIQHLKLTEEPKNWAKKDDLMKSTSKRKSYATRYITLESILYRWCPNLKSLEIPVPQFSREAFDEPDASDDDDVSTPDLQTNFEKVVKLDFLSLGCRMDMVYLEDVEKMATKVFEYCKEIKSLRLIKDAVEGIEEDDLNDLPQISPDNCFSCMDECLVSLHTLDLSNYTVYADCLSILTHMPLEDLKIVKINVLMEEDGSVPNRALDTFLQMYGPQLDTLELSGNSELFRVYNADTTFQFWDIDARDPILQLSEFKLFNAYLRTIHIRELTVDLSGWIPKNLDFLLNFSSLKSLTLTCPPTGLHLIPDTMFSTSLRGLHLKRMKLENVEVLKLDFDILLTRTAPSLARCFPNIKKLWVSLPSCVTVATSCFEDFSTLAELDTLEIAVRIPVPGWWEGGKGLQGIACHPESYPNLKHIHVYAEGTEAPLPLEKKIKLSEQFIPVLSNIQTGPALRNLRLTDFKIMDDAYDALKLMNDTGSVKVQFKECKLVKITISDLN